MVYYNKTYHVQCLLDDFWNPYLTCDRFVNYFTNVHRATSRFIKQKKNQLNLPAKKDQCSKHHRGVFLRQPWAGEDLILKYNEHDQTI